MSSVDLVSSSLSKVAAVTCSGIPSTLIVEISMFESKRKKGNKLKSEPKRVFESALFVILRY